MILWEFYNNLKGLQRWRQYIFRIHPKTKAEIRNSIKEIQKLQRTEKDPPVILLSNGWSPYLAKDFLKNIGLHTDHYMHYYNDEWGITSNNLHLSEDLLANDVNYNINGNRQAATLLKLRLIVFDLSKKANAHEQFLYYVNCLWTKIFSEMITEDIEMAILESKNFKCVKMGYEIEVELESFDTVLKGYELKFKITHPEHKVPE